MSEAEAAAPALYELHRNVRRALQELRIVLVGRLPSVTTLVEACDDFESGRVVADAEARLWAMETES
ncbi:hypothetical protein [Streptomyces adustus]|uniref:hypothetical protein n=1 Tax=Streptomyces adustus TaxID=1609272 RepID=UPI00372160C4